MSKIIRHAAETGAETFKYYQGHRISMVKTLEKTAKKWVDRVSVSSEDYKDGVTNPSKDWAARATAAKAKYASGVTKAITEGSREAGIARRGNTGWKEKTIAKSDRFSEGVRLAEDDFKKEMGKVLAFEDALQKKVNALPDATLEDRIKKSAEWQREMAKFKK